MTHLDSEALQAVIQQILHDAGQYGATAAEADVSKGVGLSVTVRKAEVETIEHEQDTNLDLTVFVGQSKASASTADLSPKAIEDPAKAACAIAKQCQEDPDAGLADADLMATSLPDLASYYPWPLETEQAIAIAASCEQSGLNSDSRIQQSEGATLSTYQGQYVYGNSHGFIGINESTRHSLSCSFISQDEQGMQRDYWYDIARDPSDLAPADEIGLIAAKRTTDRLNARPIKTGEYPVIFAANIATSLFQHFSAAISGGALYRQASFLLDAKGQPIFPDFIDIYEQPYLLKALGSNAFDNEGVATNTDPIIERGVLQRYLLSSYSARKLGLVTTGNAGGVNNLTVSHQALDFATLLQEMGRGILVTETMGMGVNTVTGDYSQGAAGFWVENGVIQYPIDEFTIAGQLRDMLMGVQAIASDIELRGNIRTGSVWLDKMMVAGN